MIDRIDLRNFIFGLVGKRTRRRYILRYWARTQLLWGSTPKERIERFIHYLLYVAVEFRMTEYGIFLCGNYLSIPYQAMTQDELTFVAKMFSQREALFKNKTITEYGFTFSGCTFDSYDLWDIEWRHELLRDFIIDSLQSFEKDERTTLWVLFLEIVQHLICNPEKQRHIDKFLGDLHHVLQGHGRIGRLLTKVQ